MPVRKSSSGTGINTCTYCKFSKVSQGSFFSFSIRGFPATVRVAVHLLTLLKCSHFSIPWASSWLTSWLTAGAVSLDPRPEEALQPGVAVMRQRCCICGGPGTSGFVQPVFKAASPLSMVTNSANRLVIADC